MSLRRGTRGRSGGERQKQPTTRRTGWSVKVRAGRRAWAFGTTSDPAVIGRGRSRAIRYQSQPMSTMLIGPSG